MYTKKRDETWREWCWLTDEYYRENGNLEIQSDFITDTAGCCMVGC